MGTPLLQEITSLGKKKRCQHVTVQEEKKHGERREAEKNMNKTFLGAGDAAAAAAVAAAAAAASSGSCGFVAVHFGGKVGRARGYRGGWRALDARHRL